MTKVPELAVTWLYRSDKSLKTPLTTAFPLIHTLNSATSLVNCF
jgi:hypothetical protein